MFILWNIVSLPESISLFLLLVCIIICYVISWGYKLFKINNSSSLVIIFLILLACSKHMLDHALKSQSEI